METRNIERWSAARLAKEAEIVARLLAVADAHDEAAVVRELARRIAANGGAR